MCRSSTWAWQIRYPWCARVGGQGLLAAPKSNVPLSVLTVFQGGGVDGLLAPL